MKESSTKKVEDQMESDKSKGIMHILGFIFGLDGLVHGRPVFISDQALSQTGSLLEKRLELRSYPITARTAYESESAESSERERSGMTSQLRHRDPAIRFGKPLADELARRQESDETAESSDKEKKAERRSSDRPIHDHKSLFRRLFENTSSVSLPTPTTGSLNLSTSSLDQRAEEATVNSPLGEPSVFTYSSSRRSRSRQFRRHRGRPVATSRPDSIASRS